MHNVLDYTPPGSDAAQALQALPPGISFWWVRGKVLHTEIIQRPEFIEGTGMAPTVQLDTIVAVQDRFAPTVGYEVRFKGRADKVAPGDELELIGHHVEPYPFVFVPRIALSMKAGHWWYAMRPIRQNEPGFVIRARKTLAGWQSTYGEENKGWSLISVPRPTDAVPPPSPPTPSALGKLFSALPPSAAPAVEAIAPAVDRLAPMVGKLRKAMTPAPPAYVTIDLTPVYDKVCDGFWAYARQQKEAQSGEQAAPQPDRGDPNLPPI